MWKVGGRRREIGLGSSRDVSLGKARERAAEARRLVAEGLDPLSARSKPRGISFGEAADALLESMAPSWRSKKHQEQWRTTLTVYCAAIRSLPVGQITTEDVLRVIRPLWLSKSETASRLRGRIERILDFAKARGMRAGENPARWRGHLDAVLPRRQKLSRGHHKALSFEEVPAFLERLREMDGIAPRGLELLILTAGRTGEVLGAKWEELDIDAKLWTVPAKRMKAGREHRVPLSARALAVVAELRATRTAQYVFPGQKQGMPLSSTSLDAVLRRMQVKVTVHGFRSAFRDWAGERTNFPREVAEAALAHQVGDAVERAYRRGDALEKRRQLMEAWAKFSGGRQDANVLSMIGR